MEVVLIAQEDLQSILNDLKDIKELLKGAASVDNEILSNSEVCGLLHVSNRTLQNYRDKGMIQFSQVGRKINYTKTDIREFLKKNKQ
jgi:excisionase family DNA binding protein